MEYTVRLTRRNVVSPPLAHAKSPTAPSVYLFYEKTTGMTNPDPDVIMGIKDILEITSSLPVTKPQNMDDDGTVTV